MDWTFLKFTIRFTITLILLEEVTTTHTYLSQLKKPFVDPEWIVIPLLYQDWDVVKKLRIPYMVSVVNVYKCILMCLVPVSVILTSIINFVTTVWFSGRSHLYCEFHRWVCYFVYVLTFDYLESIRVVTFTWSFCILLVLFVQYLVYVTLRNMHFKCWSVLIYDLGKPYTHVHPLLSFPSLYSRFKSDHQ